MEIPLWHMVMLTPQEYCAYANISRDLVYKLCNNKTLPCIKNERGQIRIHREEADKKLAEMAINHEGHKERQRTGEILEAKRQRRRKAQ